MKLSIIVPCYNEVENVTKLSNELLPVVEGLLIHGGNESPDIFHSVEMIFVDDGSRDGTYSRLKECFRNNNAGVSFKFLMHETNLGLGAAIRTGFLNADGDIVVTVDSDGTYKFSEIPGLLSLLTSEVDIVTASPYHPQGGVVGVPAYRLFLSRGSSLYTEFSWIGIFTPIHACFGLTVQKLSRKPTLTRMVSWPAQRFWLTRY
jgi:dolichol-phosphate mannosyltransferase